MVKALYTIFNHNLKNEAPNETSTSRYRPARRYYQS
jgi:hypothetical protein